MNIVSLNKEEIMSLDKVGSTASEANFYLYTLKLNNVFGEGFDSTTKKIAKILSEKTLSDQVIDLRENGSHTQGCYIVSQTVHILTNTKLPEELQKMFVDSVNSQKELSLEHKKALQMMGDLHNPNVIISEQKVEHPYIAVHQKRGKVEKKFFEVIKFPIPRLTNGPLTGLQDDSWNHACETPAAKQWIRDNSIDVLDECIEFTEKNGERIHSIGFVNQ